MWECGHLQSMVWKTVAKGFKWNCCPRSGKAEYVMGTSVHRYFTCSTNSAKANLQSHIPQRHFIILSQTCTRHVKQRVTVIIAKSLPPVALSQTPPSSLSHLACKPPQIHDKVFTYWPACRFERLELRKSFSVPECRWRLRFITLRPNGCSSSYLLPSIWIPTNSATHFHHNYFFCAPWPTDTAKFYSCVPDNWTVPSAVPI